MDEPTYIQIFWTCGNLDEARAISRELVTAGLVACANIIPWVESLFLWNGELDTTQETKVIFKTRADRFDAVKKAILAKAKYEIPEILKIPILGGNEAYLDWIDQNTKIMR